MCRIDYAAEHRAQVRYALDEKLSKNERLLLNAFLFVFAERAGANHEWPDGFISVSNWEMSSWSGLDKRAIETARNTLKQRGVIDFRAGSRSTKNPEYKLNYFTGCKNVPSVVPTDVPTDVPSAVPRDVSRGVPSAVPTDAPLYSYSIYEQHGIKKQDEGQKNEDQKRTGYTGGRECARGARANTDGNGTEWDGPNGNGPADGDGQADGDPALTCGGTPDDSQGERAMWLCLSTINDAWKTSQRARGAVAQRIVEYYPGGGLPMKAHDIVFRALEAGITPETIMAKWKIPEYARHGDKWIASVQVRIMVAEEDHDCG